MGGRDLSIGSNFGDEPDIRPNNPALFLFPVSGRTVPDLQDGYPVLVKVTHASSVQLFKFFVLLRTKFEVNTCSFF